MFDLIHTIRRYIFGVLYYCIVAYLPPSYAFGGKLFRMMRFVLCKQLFKSCGCNVDIGRNASFGLGRDISIGSGSGIGINARLNGQIVIGNEVMMGPDVMILGFNHEYSRTDISIGQQGYSKKRNVNIGDNVWIGARAIIQSWSGKTVQVHKW